MTGGAAAAIAAIFVLLAQWHIILVPSVSPTLLQVDGLKSEYSRGDKAIFSVTAKGYGSNCHLLQVQATDQNGERASFYKKADDCRYMVITHGPYNFTRSFEYGNEVLAKQGTYNIDIQFEDLKDGTKVSVTRSIAVQ